MLATILSENMTPALWQELARAVHGAIADGAAGVLVTHGTDTMSYSAAALAFMLSTPVPVVFVGSQRSADRPSSDNVMNGVCAASAAVSDLGEVAVVMHEGPRTTGAPSTARHASAASTPRGATRSGLSVRPSSGRSPSPSGRSSSPPTQSAAARGPSPSTTGSSPTAASSSSTPAWSPAPRRVRRGRAGLVVAGTGLGHVSTPCIDRLGALVENGTSVVMTSQCLDGRVCDRVYDTGRDLLACGVIEGRDHAPEVALVKMMCVLGRTRDPDEVAALMQADLAGEVLGRTPHGL